MDPLAYIGIVASIAEVVTALCADRIKAMRDPGLDARALGELADVSVSFAWLSLYVVTQFQPTPLFYTNFVSFHSLISAFVLIRSSSVFPQIIKERRLLASAPRCTSEHAAYIIKKFLYSLIFLEPHCSLAGLLVGF